MPPWCKIGALVRIVNVDQECNRYLIGKTGRITAIVKRRWPLGAFSMIDCAQIDGRPESGMRPCNLEPVQPDGNEPSKWEYCLPELQELIHKAKEPAEVPAFNH